MNVMSDQQRTDVTNAALAEILAETGNLDIDIGLDGITLADYRSSCLKNGCKETDPIMQILSSADESFQNTIIVDIDEMNGAVTSYNPTTNTYTVSFCGTRNGYGEWTDNGIGLSEADSQAQRNAAEYFDLVSSKFVKDGAKVVVTGHSKGGNKAEYVTMFAQNRSQIDQCVSLDGQQFSKQARENMQSHADYDLQRSKIMLVCGENDYVSQLGEQIVPSENTFYLSDSHRMSEEGLKDAAFGDHIVSELFVNSNGQYTSELNIETNQGALGGFVREFYVELSQNLSDSEFHEVCRVLMDVFEGNISKEELAITIGLIAPSLEHVLYDTEAGKKMLDYLPVTLLSNEDMQGSEGALKLFCCWLLTLDSDSPGVKFMKKALGVFNIDFYTMEDLLSKLSSFISQLATYWKKTKDFLYINFRIGAEEYNEVTNVHYANTNDYFYFDTDEIRAYKASIDELKTAITTTSGLYKTAFYAYHQPDSNSIIKEIYNAAKQSLFTGNESAMNSARQKMTDACTKLTAISKALQDIADKLEAAENTAMKYGSY